MLSLMGAALTAEQADAAEDRWADLLAFVEKEHKAGTFPGAALIASKNGKIQIDRIWGTYCGLTNRIIPLRREVRHCYFSYSKLVSATVVVMAHEDGRFDYDAPVKTYLPEFVGGGKEKITVRHLLTHSAGIPSVALGRVSTEEEWQTALDAVCAAKTEWEPGSRTAYHALSGLFTAACVVRRVMGNRSWEQICRDRLFAPLAASSLTFAVPPETMLTAITPQPKELPKKLDEAFGFAGHPAGGCFGTVTDALKVLQLHLNGGTWGRKRLLSQESLAEMHRVQYGKEIARARSEGKEPVYEPWGLGPLMRGTGAKAGAHDWFGFRDQTDPGIFGHAGIDTVIGVASPASGNALFFVTTNSPPSSEATVNLRNGVTNRVFAALG